MDRHPTIKILVLSFLFLVGVTLIVEGFDVHVPKGYIYLRCFEKRIRRGPEIFFASEWVTYKPYSLPSVKFNHATAKNI